MTNLSRLNTRRIVELRDFFPTQPLTSCKLLLITSDSVSGVSWKKMVILLYQFFRVIDSRKAIFRCLQIQGQELCLQRRKSDKLILIKPE